MILIEKNEMKNDNIENNLILDELICNCEIARDKTTFDCVLLNKNGKTTVQQMILFYLPYMMCICSWVYDCLKLGWHNPTL